MSNLSPAAITLDKGLDLQTPKTVAEAGSILDTLNYEQVDFQGQKRIDGYTRYDGSLLATLDEYYVISSGESLEANTGSLLATDKGLLGVVVGNDNGAIQVAVINEKFIPKANEDVYPLVAGVKGDAITITSILKGRDSGLTPEEHYTKLLNYSGILRSKVEDLPGGIIGLQWFRDRLYAVADVVTLYIDDTTPDMRPRDIVTNGTDTAEVLDVRIIYDEEEPIGSLVFLNSVQPGTWADYTGPVYRDGVNVGNAIISNIYDYSDEVASFFESRTEQQTLDEDGPNGPYDFGWRFIHLGWEVNFVNGNVAYGDLVAKNQNKENVGIQGPTGIDGTAGSPLNLLQKVTITNSQTQVNGWKSSETPDSYQLDASDVSVDDATYAYADAFIQWDNDGVRAPGSDMIGLIEYSPTSTIVYTTT